MGKPIIGGYGRDAGDDTKIIAMTVAIGIAVIVVVFLVIGAMSDYHGGGWGQPTIYGIRFGDIVFAATNLRVILTIVLAVSTIGGIIRLKPLFGSWITVYEEGVKGVSKSKEAFEFKHSQISSAHTQDESRWKSVIINVSGKTFQVYTVQSGKIAAEINKRRGA